MLTLFFRGVVRPRRVVYFCALLFCLFLSVYPQRVAATVQFQSEALANCEASMALHPGLQSPYCAEPSPGFKGYRIFSTFEGHSQFQGCDAGYDCAWITDSDIPGDQCKAKPSFFSSFNGNASDGLCDAGCGYAADPTAGITITRNAVGQAAVAATFRPTGATCDGSGGGATNPTPPPDSPSAFVPKPSAPPKVCGGGSCYNPTTGDGCALVEGVQLCHKFPTSAQPSGGCVSDGSGATLCVGSPPPMPGNPPIADPPSNIRSSDNYQQQNNAPSGPVLPVVVNVYTPSPATSVDSGQGAGDSGPAPASSAPGGPESSSGGGDCNTPPIVNGSPALAQVAFQTWKTRCAIEGSNSAGGVVGGLGDLYTPSTDTVSSVVGEFKAGVAASPVVASVPSFFSVGSVGGACPVWTVPESDWLPAQTFDFYCTPGLADLLDMARFVLLIGCAYAAWRIAMGDA